jgi:hypothetical protein
MKLLKIILPLDYYLTPLIPALIWPLIGGVIASALFRFVVVFLGLGILTYVGIDHLVDNLTQYIQQQLNTLQSQTGNYAQFGLTVMQSGGFFSALTNLMTGFTLYLEIISAKKILTFFKK